MFRQKINGPLDIAHTYTEIYVDIYLVTCVEALVSWLITVHGIYGSVTVECGPGPDRQCEMNSVCTSLGYLAVSVWNAERM